MASCEGACTTAEARIVSLYPDVCLVPPGNTPTPFQSSVHCSSSAEEAPNVRYGGLLAHHFDTHYGPVVGHDPGAGGGMKNGAYQGWAYAAKSCEHVLILGRKAVRDGTLYEVNCRQKDRQGNTRGKLIYVLETKPAAKKAPEIRASDGEGVPVEIRPDAPPTSPAGRFADSFLNEFEEKYGSWVPGTDYEGSDCWLGGATDQRSQDLMASGDEAGAWGSAAGGVVGCALSVRTAFNVGKAVLKKMGVKVPSIFGSGSKAGSGGVRVSRRGGNPAFKDQAHKAATRARAQNQKVGYKP